jgi:hypothetical protein
MEITFTRRAVVAGLSVLAVTVVATVIALISPGAKTHGTREGSPNPPSTLTALQVPSENLTDDAAMQVACQSVRAYFTVDPDNQSGWVQAMDALTPGADTIRFLDALVWPEIARAGVRSSPGAVDAHKVLEGLDSIAHRRWQVWEATVQGVAPWPAPAPQPIGPFAIPWAGSSSVTLYVTVFEDRGHWSFGLFPVKELVAQQVAERELGKSQR